MDFDFGKEPANTFTRDQHPDLRADFVMANPPFNMKEWKDGVADDDVRWKYGVPPASNANFAWLQHMVHHLAPNGSMALLLANGSMSSNTNNEGEIRKALIEADLVECMVALPGQLFTNTQIPACVWFLTRTKAARNGWRDRKGETLFIDARNLGYMIDRVLRDFAVEDIQKIADTFHAWKRSSPSPALALIMFHISSRWTLKTFCGILRVDGQRYGGVRSGCSARDSQTHQGGGARSSRVVAGGSGAPGLPLAQLARCRRQGQSACLSSGAVALGAAWPDRFATRAPQCALWRSKFCSDTIERSFETRRDA
jgi:type I restriction-modification system DNA methylase subunit